MKIYKDNEECCNTCAFIMKVPKRKRKCVLANAYTKPQYICEKYIAADIVKKDILNQQKTR